MKCLYINDCMNEIPFSPGLLKLANVPLKYSIWKEIMKQEGITAKELKSKLYLEGTSIYFHLNVLEANDLIFSNMYKIPNSNLSQKMYRINNSFLSKEERKEEELRGSHERIKDILLLKTTIIINYFQQQVRQLSKIANEDIKKLVENGLKIRTDKIKMPNNELSEILGEITHLKNIYDKLNNPL